MNPQTRIPEIIYENWDIDQYYRITNHHIVLSATQKKTGISRVLTIIPNPCFDKKLWKNLICLPDDKLLLPQKIYAVKDVHVLEFPICTPLKKLVQTEKLSLSQIITLIQDLCNSLDCLHDTGILHMDISADNVYLTKEQSFILGDFSESCYPSDTTHPFSSQRLHSMAPECRKEPPSVLSEQYQLGILFYQLCNNGNAPPDGFCGIIPQKLQALQTTPEIADPLKAILSKMLAQKPSERYSHLSVLQQDLKALQDLDCLSAHTLELSNYQLFLPDITHPFHQELTIRDLPSVHLPSIRFSFLFLPLVPVCLALILLFGHKLSSSQNRPNQVTEVPKEPISTGPALSFSTDKPAKISTVLDIAGKNITSFASVSLPDQNENNIQILLAENNNITSLSDIFLFPNLRELYLSNNQITDLSDLTNLPDLETVVLSDNLCTDLSGLGSLHKLRFLDLSGNPELVETHDLYTLTSLETLILSDTSVNQDSIKQLQQALPDCNIIF